MSLAKPSNQLITELQTRGLRMQGAAGDHVSRRGGAGPSDHQAITVDGTTVMVPIYTQSAWSSPFSIESVDEGHTLLRDQIPITDITFLFGDN